MVCDDQWLLIGDGQWLMPQVKACCHRAPWKKVISDIGFFISNCRGGATISHKWAPSGHKMPISTNHMPPRCQSCVEFNHGSWPWAPFSTIFKHSKVIGGSNLSILLFLIFAQGGPNFGQKGLLATPCNRPHSFCRILGVPPCSKLPQMKACYRRGSCISHKAHRA